MNRAATNKSPFERILDKGVYAPLGFLLRREELRDDLAMVGRKQVAFARSLGRAALKTVGQARVRPAGADTPTPSSPAATSRPAASPQGPASAGSAEVDRAATQAPTAGAIPGYSDKTARDIIALLRTATPAQARWSIEQESAGKQRVTVLRAAQALLDRDD